MKKVLCLVSLTIFSFVTAVSAAEFKKGDLIERQGEESKVWFQGEVLKKEGNAVTIGLWGWMDGEPETFTEFSRLRAFVPKDVVVRKNGAVWAIISKNGDIRVNGNIVGSINSSDGLIRKGGSIAGEIYFNGAIRKNGSEVGAIFTRGDLYRDGQIIGGINNQDGTIRLHGSIVGQIDNFSHTYREMRLAAAVLAFFAPEFGY